MDRKEMLDKITKGISEMSDAELKYLYRNFCSHQTLQVPKKKDIESGCASAKCAECSDYLGWYCPDSKDNRCYYESEERDGKNVVELSTGEVVAMDEDHDPEYETSDSCLFCGQPDERK